MYILRSINPHNGYMKEFQLKENEPVLIGRSSHEMVQEYPEGFLGGIPDGAKEQIFDDIKRVKYSITMKICKIDFGVISRLHCIIFPGKNAQILDLFSTNRTAIARLSGGLILDPGKKTDLLTNDIIILARGSAILQYLIDDL